jgi:hypothetical protein
MIRKTLRYRPVQPAHHSDRITVQQAIEAFRAVERKERASVRTAHARGRRSVTAHERSTCPDP